MGAGDEQFCLRWNDFQESILSTLQDLRAEEDFVDVTLVCDGGRRQLAAHKLILSACSDFFRAVLKRNPAPNPVIVLWDMSADDVAKILRFMYNGEVEVKQAHLNAFLAVAERLRVRGLCQSGGKNSPNRPSSPVPSTSKGAASNSSTHKEHHRSSSHKTSTSRRSSDDKGESASKRPKLLEDSVTVKEEELERESPGKQHQESGSIQEDGGSLLSRSAAGSSESDQAEYGVGSSSASAFGAEGFDDHTGITSAALMGMGMPPRIDPAAAKEFWRRAAMARMSGMGDGSGGAGGVSPPANPFTHFAAAAAAAASVPPPTAPNEPTRRQRSVYSSRQIAQLEAYFQMNEYIDGERKKQLSLMTKIPEQQIKVWFQNRRQKKKREQEEQQQMAREQLQMRQQQNRLILAATQRKQEQEQLQQTKNNDASEDDDHEEEEEEDVVKSEQGEDTTE